MGKKSKVGKQRKDKYYQLAKETGYRSRAAFKLIQLNRKFGFLQKSRVCIDLCAAPGGWMQVAQQNMPLSSIVIGVDLFPIKTVPGCISLTEDITTDKCKTAISKEIKTWKADVVLNDGAPNVGLNWLHDAYQQATLTLSALKLATHFLREGGWFVTKVFRSKDYHPLIWVFKQLFKKVHATKPQASRNESSEIFVVCQGYLAPDSIDSKFLDHKYVFEEFEVANKNRFNLLHPEKAKKAKAEGYEENDYTQHHAVPVSKFLALEDPIDALRGCSQITFDDDKSIERHPKTTVEIKECCRDIKVLGRKDLKSLLTWLKHMKEFKASQEAETKPVQEAAESEKQEEKESDEEDKIDEQIAEIQEEERRQSKRKRKQLNKQRQKLADKMNLKMVLKGDDGPILESNDMFQLKDIRDANEMKKIIDQQPDTVVDESGSEDEMRAKAKFMKYDVEDSKLDKSGAYYKDSDSDLEIETDSESEQEKEGLGFSDSEEDKKKINKITKQNTAKNSKPSSKKAHPLLTDLEKDPASRRSMKAELWFQKDSFKELNEDDDEDVDLDKLADTFKKKGKKVSQTAISDKQSGGAGVLKRPGRDSGVASESEDSDSDYDVEHTVSNKKADQQRNAGGAGAAGDDFQVVSEDKELKRLKRTMKMDSETLALGGMIAASKKFKRDLMDDAWNRYMFQDTNLPDWFVEDETKNMRRPVVVPESEQEEYRKRMQEINARPIKKVIEAKARKKKRMLKKMERAKKKVEAVMDNADIPEREKAKQVKQLYRKAGSDPKKEVKYVVAKKHTTAKRMKRPAGVKGHYKVVDPRMKKDLRAQKSKEKTMGRKKKQTNKKPTNKKQTNKKQTNKKKGKKAK